MRGACRAAARCRPHWTTRGSGSTWPSARALVLDARVSLYNITSAMRAGGSKTRRMPLRRIRQRHVDAGNTDSVRSLSAAIEHLEEAQRLAGKLDPAANSKAGEALEAVRVATCPLSRRYLRIGRADLHRDLAIRDRIGRLRHHQRLAWFQHDDHSLIQARAAFSSALQRSRRLLSLAVWLASVAGCTRAPADTLRLPFGRICGFASMLMMARLPPTDVLPVLRMLPAARSATIMLTVFLAGSPGPSLIGDREIDLHIDGLALERRAPRPVPACSGRGGFSAGAESERLAS